MKGHSDRREIRIEREAWLVALKEPVKDDLNARLRRMYEAQEAEVQGIPKA